MNKRTVRGILNEYRRAGLSLIKLCSPTDPHTHGDGSGEVVPCEKTQRGKVPQEKGWQRLAGQKMDERRISLLADRDGNFGLVIPKNLVVLDADSKKDYRRLREWLQARRLKFWQQRTRRGGHFILRQSSLGAIGNAVKRELEGIVFDIRGVGGQIVVFPSIHNSGVRYKWIIAPWQLPRESLSVVPPEILSRQEPREIQVTAGNEIPEGTRNATLFNAACSLRRSGMLDDAVLALVEVVNTASCKPPLSSGEVRSLVKSSSRYGPNTLPIYEGGFGALRPEPDPVSLGKLEEPGPRIEILGGLIQEGYPNIIYGDGGQGKSLVGLRIAMTYASGRPFLGYRVERRRVLYADWELSQEEQLRRAFPIARGMGLEHPPKRLRYANPLRSISNLVPYFQEWIKKFNFKLIVIDSVGIGSGINTEAAEDVTKLFDALRSLGVTLLLVDHQAKPQKGERKEDKTPFGSAYKFNLARSVIHMYRVSSEENRLNVLLCHTKNNFGPLHVPIGLRISFSKGQTFFKQVDIREDAGFSKHLHAEDKVLRSLTKDGPATTKVLEDRTGVAYKTLQNLLPQMRDEGKVVEYGKEGRAIIWAIPKANNSGIKSRSAKP